MSTGVADLEPGTTFAGQFRVVRKLAQGGMGAVYVAEQITTGQQRALKLMHPGLVSSRELRDKFTLEARVGAKIAERARRRGRRGRRRSHVGLTVARDGAAHRRRSRGRA